MIEQLAPQHIADYDLGFLIEPTQTEAVPPAISDPDASGPMASTGTKCRRCNRDITANPGDPAKAMSAKDFLRWKHATDPDAYHAALTAHPVNLNINRDETSHELPYDSTLGDEDDTLIVDRDTYRSWLEQQFS